MKEALAMLKWMLRSIEKQNVLRKCRRCKEKCIWKYVFGIER